MKLPDYFLGKKCTCKAPIEIEDIKEIGIHLEQREVFLRFKCSYCGFKGCISIKNKFDTFLNSLISQEDVSKEEKIIPDKKIKSFTQAEIRKAKKILKETDDVLSLLPPSPIAGKKRKKQNKKK